MPKYKIRTALSTGSRPDHCLPAALLIGLLLLCNQAGEARASEPDEPIDIEAFSLEDLADVVVTSVSKKEERKQAAAAAIFVLTGEEIRAHGARSLPEALRLVPGLSVARSDSRSWAVSARGLNSFLADKMEVVLDGRSLYTPLFSGVFWDAHSTFMDDIERIEVIRGPGASVWGANAVHGVINIVTRSAQDTQNSKINVGLGSDIKRHASGRHGGKIGDNGHYRVYAQGRDYNNSESPRGLDNQDAWHHLQAGFRSDWLLDSTTDLTVQGDVYESDQDFGQIEGKISGFNLISRWTRQLDNHASLSVQGYFDHIERLIPTQFDEDRDQINLEMIHNFRFREDHDLVWGIGYRRSDDHLISPGLQGFSFDPEKETLETFSLFVQDQLALSEQTTLTLGTKIENNDFTGTEIQPTLRIAWTPDPQHTWWGSLSRAVRTPNRLDRDVNIMGFTGSESFESEVALTAETGYRFPYGKNTSVDLVAFYTDYDKLRAIDTSTPPPFAAANLGEGHSWGVEASALWIPSSQLRVLFAYRYLDIDLEFPPTGIDAQLSADPQHQAFIRGTYELRDNLELAGMLRYVDKLTGDDSLQGANPEVPSYTELGAGLTYRFSPRIEWSIHGENLLHSSHIEFGNNAAIERRVYTQLKWRF